MTSITCGTVCSGFSSSCHGFGYASDGLASSGCSCTATSLPSGCAVKLVYAGTVVVVAGSSLSLAPRDGRLSEPPPQAARRTATAVATTARR